MQDNNDELEQVEQELSDDELPAAATPAELLHAFEQLTPEQKEQLAQLAEEEAIRHRAAVARYFQRHKDKIYNYRKQRRAVMKIARNWAQSAQSVWKSKALQDALDAKLKEVKSKGRK